jgi:hypothetical protein
MYQHYEEVTGDLPAFPEQAIYDSLITMIRKSTPSTVNVVHKLTGEGGRLDAKKLVWLCESAIKSPRALRQLFAA